MKIGDKVKMSERNMSVWGIPCAYIGMEGLVTDIWDDGGFCIKGAEGVLVVPLNRPAMFIGNLCIPEKLGVWIYLNGEHIYHKKKTITINLERSKSCIEKLKSLWLK